MTTIYEVDSQKFNEKLAEELKKMPEFEVPEWAGYVKTSVNRARPPASLDFWYNGSMVGVVGYDSSAAVMKLMAEDAVGDTSGITIANAGAVTAYHSTNKKFETTAYGVRIQADDNAYADIEISGSIVQTNRFELLVNLIEPDQQSTKIKFIWDGTRNELIEQVII